MQKSGGKCSEYVYSWNIGRQILISEILLDMCILFDPASLAWVTSLLERLAIPLLYLGGKTIFLITFLCKCFQSVLLPAKYQSSWGDGSFHRVPYALIQDIIHLPKIKLLNSTCTKYYRATDTIVEEIQSEDLAEHCLTYINISHSVLIFSMFYFLNMSSFFCLFEDLFWLI